MVLVIGSDAIMQTDTVITPKCTALKTIKAMFASSVAISTLHTACITLFYGQNIEQTVDTKVCRQSCQVSILRDSCLHSGHAITLGLALVRWIPFRQWRQKLCKQGSCFGSVNLHIQTEQETSSWRLSSKVLISMSNGRKRLKKPSSNMKSPDQWAWYVIL